jgi:hypothetical protein
MFSPASPVMKRPSAAPVLLSLCGLFAVGACNKSVQETYRITILGPNDAFAGATKVELVVADRVVDTEMVNGNAPFSLEWGNVDPLQTRSAIFAIRAVDAAGTLVAFGQTPELELLTRSEDVRIFVQRPGTLVSRPEVARKLRDPLSVAASAVPFDPALSLPMTTPLFGAGYQRAADGTMPQASPELYVYNPVLHEAQAMLALTRARVDSAGFAFTDGTVIVFGGLIAGTNPMDLRATARVDAFRLWRTDLDEFRVEHGSPMEPSEDLARSRVVLAQSRGPIYAFGGLGPTGQPLDTVVRIDPNNAANRIALLPPSGMLPSGVTVKRTMSAPRDGHTATPFSRVMSGSGQQLLNLVLVFGGAPAGGEVADLFEQGNEAFTPLPGAGTGRRDHAAILLQETPLRVLVVGGAGDDGMPRGDSLLYDPGAGMMGAFTTGPINLKTPRHGFAAFIVRDDLVVVGGFGAGGVAIANAEIYNSKTLAFVAEIPAVARGRASVTVLPNLSVVIAGGQVSAAPGADGSGAIEIYQPLRAQLP